jgi:hypothetical protein
MADRYWVGGSGNWSDTNRWSDTSGGTPGAPVPTSIDNVIFDAGSNVGTGVFTVTVNGTSSVPSVCNDFSTGGAGGALDGVMTVAFAASAELWVYGSLTLPATNLTWSGGSSAVVRLQATTTGKTITTNGVTITSTQFSFDGVGGEWTLGSALTSGGNCFVNSGSLITNNFNLSCVRFTSNSGLTRSITLGSSVVTPSSDVAVSFVATGLTFNAGTSTIVCTGANPTFAGAGFTFNNVSFTNTGTGTKTITGDNTFNNLSFTSRAAAGTAAVSFGGNQTVNGTLTFGTTNTAIVRMRVVSNPLGTQRTITLNGTLATLADVDFRDIVAAGTVGTWSGTRIGNLQNNSNITFTAGAPKYWNLAAGGNWSATAWALGSGGAVNVNNFPLAQDSVIIENAGLNTGATITINFDWSFPTISFATRTNAVTIATMQGTCYGDLTLSSAVTISGSTFSFAGNGITQKITSAGVTIDAPITQNSPGATLQLQDNLTMGSSRTFTLTAGTLDLNNRTLSTGLFFSSNTNVRSIAFGTGKFSISGNNAFVWGCNDTTNLTITGEPVVDLTYAGAVGTRTVIHGSAAGGSAAIAISVNVTAGTDIVNLDRSGTPSFSFIKNLNYTGFTGTSPTTFAFFLYGNLILNAGMTTGDGPIFFAGTSGTQTITTNGVSFNGPITFDGIGGTFAFQDAFTQNSTRAFTITNGTVQLKNGVTSTVGVFATSGTNQKFLQSTTLGSQATLLQASGTVTTQYLTIRDVNATGGATWNAFVDQGNIDAGNNDGWDFGISPIVGGNEYTYQLRSFTQPRRF